MEFDRVIVVVALAALLLACGGDGGGGDTAPSISNLRYTPASELQLPGESTAITSTVDFVDSGGNVVEMHLSTSAGALDIAAVIVRRRQWHAHRQLHGSRSTRSGSTSFEVWLQDSAGQVSNRLGGTFDVFVNETVPRWRDAPGQAELGRLLGTNGLNGLAWDGKKYVFAGSNVIVRSTDLVSWELQSTDSMLEQHCMVRDKLCRRRHVAGNGHRAVMMHSSDGLTWSTMTTTDQCPAAPPGTLPPLPFCEYRAGLSKVIWAGSQFVAVGREKVPGVGTFALILDVTGWFESGPSRRRRTLPVGADVDVYGMGLASVAWSGSRFVAVGRAADGSAALWTSLDALSWSPGTLPEHAAGAAVHAARCRLGPWAVRGCRLGRHIAAHSGEVERDAGVVGWHQLAAEHNRPAAVGTERDRCGSDSVPARQHDGVEHLDRRPQLVDQSGRVDSRQWRAVGRSALDRRRVKSGSHLTLNRHARVVAATVLALRKRLCRLR